MEITAQELRNGRFSLLRRLERQSLGDIENRYGLSHNKNKNSNSLRKREKTLKEKYKEKKEKYKEEEARYKYSQYTKNKKFKKDNLFFYDTITKLGLINKKR